jgi:hypothetical protein
MRNLMSHDFPNHRTPSVRGCGDDVPAATIRPQRSIFAAYRQVEHANRFPHYAPRY